MCITKLFRRKSIKINKTILCSVQCRRVGTAETNARSRNTAKVFTGGG